MAEISVIIPVYNAEKYIRRCLSSVLNQSFQDFRVILVDDGSKDNSLALCREYSGNDPRFVVLNKQNGGAASARNYGLDWNELHAPGKWLCFLDIDDFVHERYLELLLAAALEKHTKISMCSFVSTTKDYLDPVDVDTEAVCVKTETIWCERQINCTIPCAKLFDSEIFRGLRFPEGIIHEDEFTLYRAMFQCDTIAFLDVPLYGYYQTEVSVMRGEWTPRHMTEPEGLMAQLKFFRANGYPQAAAYTARIYLFSLYNNLIRSRDAKARYPECSVSLKKRLRTGIVKYQRLAGTAISTEPWMYYEAFPIATLPCKLLRKIRKKTGPGKTGAGKNDV